MSEHHGNLVVRFYSAKGEWTRARARAAASTGDAAIREALETAGGLWTPRLAAGRHPWTRPTPRAAPR